MTSIFNFSSTSSNPAINLNGDSSLLSHLKYPTTFIIQPPSSSQIQPTTLLTKRCKPAELGDLLMKKIKTQSSNVSDNNSQPSPLIREAYEDAIYDSSEGLECRSMIEEPRSPSTKSYNEDSKANQQKMIEELLMPQRSLSTPIVASLNFSSKDKNSQKQLQNALETLQKRMVLEQQASIIKNILQRAKLAEPLIIPPLQAIADRSISSFKNINEPEKPVFKSLEGEPEIFVGEIEYPLLSLAPKGSESGQKNFGFPSMSNVVVPKRGKKALSKLSTESSPVSDLQRHSESLFESLAVTRAETQRSDSDSSEEYEKTVGRKRKGKKAAVDKVKKSQKKEEKVKGKKQKKEELLLSPLVKGKKMSERKMNKWQKEADKPKEELVM